jgi:phosphatidate cytidylyltransferase
LRAGLYIPQNEYATMTRQTREDVVSLLIIAVIVCIVFAILWLTPTLVFGMLAIFVSLVAFKELNSFYKIDVLNFQSIGFFGLVIQVLLLTQALLFPERALTVSLSLGFILLVSVTALLSKNPTYEEFSRLSALVFSLLYTVLPFSLLIAIRFMPHGRAVITSVILIVWAREQGAGLGGLLFPRAGLALNPRINPGKTYIGALIGLFTAILVAVLVTHLFSLEISISKAIVWGLVVGIACQLGDLSESYLKRSANKRHSSGLLGPEGGLLDILDAFSFAVVVTYILLFLTTAPVG